MDKYSQRNKGKLEKKSIRLFKGDAEFLDEFYPRAGHTIIIRILVRNFCKKLQENFNRKEIPDELRGLTLEGSGEGEPS